MAAGDRPETRPTRGCRIGHESSTSFDEEFHSLRRAESVTLLNQADSNPEAILARDDDSWRWALEMPPVEIAARSFCGSWWAVLLETPVAGIPMGTVMSRLRALAGCWESVWIGWTRSHGMKRNQRIVAGPQIGELA